MCKFVNGKPSLDWSAFLGDGGSSGCSCSWNELSGEETLTDVLFTNFSMPSNSI